MIAGTGANSTREAIELTQLAKDVGVDACLSVMPYYNKPTQEGLYQHFKAIASAVDVPIFLYNVPGRTVCDMKPETVERLTECPNIVGLKEACSLERNRELLNRVGGRLALFSGDDDLACEAVLAGFQGVVSVTANIAPRQVRAVMDAALAGKRDEARKLDRKLQPLHKAMFLESNPIPVKWAAAQVGPDYRWCAPAAGAAVPPIPWPGARSPAGRRHRVRLIDRFRLHAGLLGSGTDV